MMESHAFGKLTTFYQIVLSLEGDCSAGTKIDLEHGVLVGIIGTVPSKALIDEADEVEGNSLLDSVLARTSTFTLFSRNQ